MSQSKFEKIKNFQTLRKIFQFFQKFSAREPWDEGSTDFSKFKKKSKIAQLFDFFKNQKIPDFRKKIFKNFEYVTFFDF